MIRVASFGELDPIELYRILHLRSAVFGVEQQCLYNDLDGRDPSAIFVWFEEDARVLSALRILVADDGTHILGRIVTEESARHRGLAGALIDHALTLVAAGAPTWIQAQARLEAWYGRWGFQRSGEDVWEDGIRHIPMTRPPR
ncbi:MAG: GNAT family N-acetyltransferase [Acidimicrobiales bacterium]